MKALNITQKVANVADSVLQSPWAIALESTVPGLAGAIQIEHAIKMKVDEAEGLFQNIPKSGADKKAWAIAQTQALLNFGFSVASDIGGHPITPVVIDPAVIGQVIDLVVALRNLRSQVAASIPAAVAAPVPA